MPLSCKCWEFGHELWGLELDIKGGLRRGTERPHCTVAWLRLKLGACLLSPLSLGSAAQSGTYLPMLTVWLITM